LRRGGLVAQFSPQQIPQQQQMNVLPEDTVADELKELRAQSASIGSTLSAILKRIEALEAGNSKTTDDA